MTAGMRYASLLTVLVCMVTIATACGTTAPNSDVGTGIRAGLTAPAAVPDDSGVTVVETGPSVVEGGKRVYGTSCKNKMWDPAPSKDNALALMKRQANEQGFNTVHSVKVEPKADAVMMNCWSAISAEGIAFNSTASPTVQ